MGGTKQLVPWPQSDGTTKPLIAAAFDAIAPVCDQMIVVLGHEVQTVQAALEPRKFQSVVADADAQMFDSIQAGLAVVAAGQRILLHLADHPNIAKATLDRLLEATERYPAKAILPTHLGQGGHPIIIPPSIVTSLATASSAGGLRAYWQQVPEACHRIAVSDPGILCDIDTPDDLRNAT
jgi:molybdenum cofactor cytidylyltransferase